MLRRTSRRFLWCWLLFHFWSSFCCCSSFRFQATFPCHRHSTLASQACEGLHQLWSLPQLLLIVFSFSSTASATVLSEYFLPTGVFYLTALPDIFGTTCFYQGLPGSRQFFLEVWRASCWSSKHRLGPSVCLIHSNPQSFIHLKFGFIHVSIAKVLLVVKTLIKKYYFFDSVLDRIRLSSRSATTLISNHKLQNNCSLKKYISKYKYKNYVNLCEFMWVYR